MREPAGAARRARPSRPPNTSPAADDGTEAPTLDKLGRLNARDFGVRCDGRHDDTAGLQATIKGARDRAHTKRGSLRVGLPRIYIPGGVCRISRTLRLSHLSGLTIEGDGPRVTQLRSDRGIPLLVMHRTSDVSVHGMTLTVGDPRRPWVGGLLENSVAVFVPEYKNDKDPANVFTNGSFDRMTFEGFHRAFLFRGNQMGDNVTWTQCKWIDNFLDFHYLNVMAFNHRVIGGEVLGFAHAAEAKYTARLAKWSRRAYPPARSRDARCRYAMAQSRGLLPKAVLPSPARRS